MTKAGMILRMVAEADLDDEDLDMLNARMTGSEEDLHTRVRRGSRYQFVEPYRSEKHPHLDLPKGTVVKVVSVQTSLSYNQYSVTVEILNDSHVATLRTMPVRDFLAHVVSVSDHD